MSLKPCCFAGTLAKGMPRGEFLILGGVRCYVSRPPAAPSVDAASPEERQLKRAVLLLTDIFGVDISNGKLIADSYASAGYLAVMPDLFDGKPVPEWFLAAMTRIIADTSPGEVGFVGRLLRQLRGAAIAARVLPAALMFARHHMDRRLTPLCKMPIVETVVEDLRSGTTLGFAVSKLGAVGFCYGGGLCFAAASRDELIDAFVTCHTQVKVPATFEPLRKPGLLICCGQDWAFPEKEVAKAQALLAQRPNGPPLRLSLYEDMRHGFANRGDEKEPAIKAAKEAALQEALAWFKQHLA